MYTIHDTRKTGCPAITEAASPEGAWALADSLGIPRTSALVLPKQESDDPMRRVARREAAERMEQLALLIDALTASVAITEVAA